MDNTKMGELIRQARKAKGLTLKDVAEKLGITDRAVSKWERGVSQTKRYHHKTHAYITSKQYNFGGKPYEKTDFLRIQLR